MYLHSLHCEKSKDTLREGAMKSVMPCWSHLVRLRNNLSLEIRSCAKAQRALEVMVMQQDVVNRAQGSPWRVCHTLESTPGAVEDWRKSVGLEWWNCDRAQRAFEDMVIQQGAVERAPGNPRWICYTLASTPGAAEDWRRSVGLEWWSCGRAGSHQKSIFVSWSLRALACWEWRTQLRA